MGIRLGLTGAIQQRLLLVLAVATLGLVGYSSYNFVHNSIQQRRRDHKDALRVAEYGLQEVLQRLNEDPTWQPEIHEGTQNAGIYQVRIAPRDSVTLQIVATGSRGSATRQIQCLLGKKSRNGKTMFAILNWEEE